MKTASSQTRWLAQESTRKVLRRVSSTAAVLAVLAAAIGVPVMSPQPDAGTNPVLAIARADCPPDCGGGPGNGGTPTGPPGGGTEFVPPSIPAMPSYDPGRGQPPLDQNNGISIYNSAAPQPSQAAQPSQAPVQNQDGTYNRAANGEQQPINHNAPNNQQLNNNWQKLSDQLNQQQSETGQNDDQLQQDNSTDRQTRCKAAWNSLNSLSDTLSQQIQELPDDDPRRQQLASQFAHAMSQALRANGVTADQCSTNASGDVDDNNNEQSTSNSQCTEPGSGLPAGASSFANDPLSNELGGASAPTTPGPNEFEVDRYVQNRAYTTPGLQGPGIAFNPPPTVTFDPKKYRGVTGVLSDDFLLPGPGSDGKLPVPGTDLDIEAHVRQQVRLAQAVPISVTDLGCGWQTVRFRLQYQTATVKSVFVGSVPYISPDTWTGFSSPQDQSSGIGWLRAHGVAIPHIPGQTPNKPGEVLQ
ncbi:Hypothetical protein ERS075552_00232 [Mycobacteroides abscessus]|nr:Hypothetical protein ERS075552_00232 [Mycobacteroides abscessus]CPW11239.1 Hypothetical protein ERS075547_01783 [Mycobacteroides abscessus]CQA10446.1 Hypothetical protein ERS075657_05465 [Mycobacteroides abscessus]